MPSLLGIELRSISPLEFRAQLGVLHVLKSRQSVGNRSHVAAALHVVLPAQRIKSAAVASYMPRKQPQVDQRQNVVHGVVMLGNAQRPADLRALCPGIGMRGLPNHLPWHASLAFRAFQRVFLHASPISLESAGRALDELLVRQSRMNNLARQRVCQRNVAAHVETQPRICPLRRARPARINHIKLRAVANPFEHVMEENRVGFPRVRAPKENYVRLFRFSVRTRPASRSENRRQTDDARGVSSSVAAVDVVRADHRAHEFLRDVIQLIGGLRATEHAERARAMLFHLRAEPGRNTVQRFVPLCRPMLPVLANQRRSQTLAMPVVHWACPHTTALLCRTYYALLSQQTS